MVLVLLMFYSTINGTINGLQVLVIVSLLVMELVLVLIIPEILGILFKYIRKPKKNAQ